jgi:hypothetical protein
VPSYSKTYPRKGLEPAALEATLIEVERPDGARWRLHYRTAPPPLVTVLRAVNGHFY